MTRSVRLALPAMALLTLVGCDQSSGSSSPCSTAADCPTPTSECMVAACVSEVCAESAISGSCSQSDGVVCGALDGALAGRCVACNADADCSSPLVCDPVEKSGHCVDPSCADGEKDGDESDVDCGGTCGACATGSACSGASDCASGYCEGETCAACTQDGQCAGDRYCETGSGVCVADLANGSPCGSAGVCASGYCVDGVCCDTACTGTCAACNVSGAAGTCSYVPGDTDPAAECPGETTCDGAGACTTFGNGTACTLSAECGSGYCVDGVCCDTACSGTCAACNLTGQAGTCAVVPAGEDPDEECAGSLTCNGMGACYLADGATCSSAGVCNGGYCFNGTCHSDLCGNGAVNSGEACDDGNNTGGDGCSSTCTVASGWACATSATNVSVCYQQASVGGYAWYLGREGESCSTVCTNLHLTYSAATLTYVGSGASDTGNCRTVASAFGYGSAPVEWWEDCGTGHGEGCSVYLAKYGAAAVNWCQLPATTAATTTSSVQGRICACQ